MPSSRATRKTIKHSNVASAAEWRLRAEMGADMPVEDEYASSTERERMRRGRAELHGEFKNLSQAERVRRTDEFRRRLSVLCVSPRAHKGAWDASFRPLLAPSTSGRRTSSLSAARVRIPPVTAPAPRATPPAKARTSLATKKRDPERAARALDVKLRVARPNDDAALARLIRQLNADRDFLEAFGGPVTEKQVREGLENVGRYRSGGSRSTKKKKKKKKKPR